MKITKKGDEKLMESESIIQLLGVYQVNKVSDVHLIELLINISPQDINVSSFTQKNDTLPREDWQVAYNEYFLNEDGTKVIGTFLEQDKLTGAKTRLAFFIYFINFQKPLSSQYGDIMLSKPTYLPERLSKIIEFEAVD